MIELTLSIALISVILPLLIFFFIRDKYKKYDGFSNKGKLRAWSGDIPQKELKEIERAIELDSEGKKLLRKNVI